MPSNIEIKAKLADPTIARSIALRLSGKPPQVLRQTDVFFESPDGRLKLRILDDTHGELILYHRTDKNRVRRSDYLIAQTSSPNSLLKILQHRLTGR